MVVKDFLKRWGWYMLPSLVLGFYLVLPTPSFPAPMDDFWRSEEPADWETPLRRGYYTNYYRGDVIWHYWDEMRQSVWPGVSLPAVRLSNYPPEDAFWLVRDQTHVNYLEELVHPMRESVFVAGQETQDPLVYFERGGERFKNKVTVKYVVSPAVVRVVVGVLGLWLGLYLAGQLVRETRGLVKT